MPVYRTRCRQQRIRRVAMLSVHTSPLAQPGTGDAGGMNVYVINTARELARSGVEVEIFTRATSSEEPPLFEAAPGVVVHHIPAGPFEGLAKNDLPTQLCAFTAGLLRTEAHNPVGHYDLVHGHYWLSGQAGWVAAERWGVPLVQTFHTLAKVKNAQLADGDEPEPYTRVIGEEQVAAEADLLIANTANEAAELHGRYGADPARVDIVHPGVDRIEDIHRPVDRRRAAGSNADVDRFARRHLLVVQTRIPDLRQAAAGDALSDRQQQSIQVGARTRGEAGVAVAGDRVQLNDGALVVTRRGAAGGGPRRAVGGRTVGRRGARGSGRPRPCWACPTRW
jgi:glycosyltransferase involved in cell wall biosynthesis